MKAGIAKRDITPNTKNIAMLGYGNPNNLVKRVETNINARALYLEDDQGEGFFLVNLELCFVTDSLFRPLVEKASELAGKNMQENVLVTAQHTHAAPGGYDHYPLYNTPTPGFVPEVLETVLSGSCQAMEAAFNSKQEADLDFVESEFAPEIDVAFNRSIMAYANNPEVESEGMPLEEHLAVDRFSRVLRIKNKENKHIGLVNWFGVHCTSLPNTNTAISPDNKGYAALEVEQRMDEKEDGFAALFNQGNAGDISPNFILDPKQKITRGPHEDSFENARFNGFLQAKKVLDMAKEVKANPVVGFIQTSLIFKDMSKVVPSRKHLPQEAPAWAETTSACHGVAFVQGTKEGPGVHPALGFVLKVAATVEKLFNFIFSFQKDEEERRKDWLFYKNQEPKSIFIKAGKKQVLGFQDLSSLPIPDALDPLVATFKRQYCANALSEYTWTQECLPVQLVKIGALLLVALPGETSTIAGLRIKRQMKEFFKEEERLKVVLSPYSNAYCGYIITPEEYDMQEYEGGHTVFGKWTLPAFQTVLEEAAKKLKDPSFEIEQDYPPQFSDVVLKARSHQS